MTYPKDKCLVLYLSKCVFYLKTITFNFGEGKNWLQVNSYDRKRVICRPLCSRNIWFMSRIIFMNKMEQQRYIFLKSCNITISLDYQIKHYSEITEIHSRKSRIVTMKSWHFMMPYLILNVVTKSLPWCRYKKAKVMFILNISTEQFNLLQRNNIQTFIRQNSPEW